MDKAEFDRFADEYYDQHRQNIAVTGEGPEYFAEYKVKELGKIVKSNELSVSKIFDFGAGIGNSIPFFRKFFPTAELTSADVSQRSLDLSKSRFPNANNLLLIDGPYLPVPDNSFDVIFSACVFHHISHNEHEHWMRELLRITRPGGIIAIFEHNPFNPLTRHAVNTCPFDVSAELITASVLLQRLSKAGWHMPRVQYNVFFPRVLAAFRPFENYLRWLPLGAQYVAIGRRH